MVFDKKDMGFQVIPYQNAGAAWNQSLMLNAMVQASEVKVLSMGYVAPIVARHKISKLCRAADLYINVHFLSFVFLLSYIVCVSFYVYCISFMCADRSATTHLKGTGSQRSLNFGFAELFSIRGSS